MAVATLASKGQVTISKPLRDHSHLKIGDRLEFLLQDDGQVVRVPATGDFAEREGMLPAPGIQPYHNTLRRGADGA